MLELTRFEKAFSSSPTKQLKSAGHKCQHSKDYVNGARGVPGRTQLN